MLAITPPTIADVPDSEINHFVGTADNLFRIFSGAVDLLAMSNQLPAEQFRQYLDVAREQRRRKRVATA